MDDREFALDDGLLPRDLGHGKIQAQFRVLADRAGIKATIVDKVMNKMLSKSDRVENMIIASYLNEKTKRNYLQTYQRKMKNLSKEN